MAAKKIQVSDDNGVTWYTLPGASGDNRSELATVGDTIFGQDFASEDASIGNWTITANAFFKSVAGYLADVRKGGTPVPMTGEVTTLVSGKTYQITNTAHRIIDLATPVVINIAAAPVAAANIESIDYLNGTVTFVAAYNPASAPTIDGAYVPTVTIGRSRSFTLTQTAAEIDDTDYETARANGGWRTYDPGLKSVRMEMGGIYDASQALLTELAARNMLYLDVAPNNDLNTLFRGFFKRTNLGQSGDVGALEEGTASLNLFVPDGALIARPFGWYFTPGTTLNMGVQKALAAWQNALPIKVRYLPDGVTGYEGDCIVTEATLANTYEGLNEFRFTFRGSGAKTTV